MMTPPWLAMVDDLMRRAPTRAQLLAREKDCEVPARAQRLDDSGIRGAITPEDYDALCTDALAHDTHALRFIRTWHRKRLDGQLRRPLTVMALVGDRGRGKTVAAGWLLAQVGGSYVTAETLRKLFVSKFEASTREFQRLLEQRTLVVDDLGTESEPQGVQAMLYAVVNQRAGLRNGWTLLTANLTEPEFYARADARTTDRIRHQGAIVTVGGENLRRGA